MELIKSSSFWVNKFKLFKSKKHSSKNIKFLRVRRKRKLSRQRNNRVNSTQLLFNSIRHISHKIIKNKMKYNQTKRNLSRLINTLKAVFYSDNTYLAKLSKSTSVNNLTLESSTLETLNNAHNYSKQSKSIKIAFRSSNFLSKSYDNVFPAVNPSNRVLKSFRPTLTKDLNFYSDVTP